MNMPVPKEALRELVGAGEAYQFLLSERDLAVLVLSENVEDCNDAACQLFGVTRQEFIGRSPLEFAPPYQPDGSPSDTSARERLASALAGLPQWCTWQYRRQDGKLVDTIVHVEAVRVDGFRRVLIRIRDVSRLERAETALVENETRMKQILDNTTAAIVFAKDLAGRYLFVNRAFERIVGLPQREIVGKTTNEIFPAETAAELMGNDARVIAAGNTITVEEDVNIGGQRRTLFTNKFPLFDSHGRPYAMCGIAADITDRKLTEEALRRAALAVSVAAGEDVFRELVGALATILGVEIAFIALHKPGAQDMLKMLAFRVDGKWIDDFEYPIAGTPCEQVIDQQYRAFPSQLGEAFELKGEFRKMGLESYAGLQLNDAHGKSLGIMTVLSRRPLPDPDLVESMLKIFAARAVTEIERNRADAALRTAEASYRAIFESAQDPIFVHDWETGAVVDVNRKACEVYGYTHDELKAITIDDISSGEHPYTVEEAGRWIQRAKAEGAVEFEWHRKNRDGSLHWDEVRLKSAVIGGERRVLAFVREITERKLAEAQLRASEEQYRAIFNGSADALMLWNSSLQRVDVNPAYERIYGYSREEVLGGAYLEAPSPEEAERRRAMVQRTLGGEPWHAELESVRKNGEPVHVEVRTMAIQYAGEPHVLAIVRDVTERRRAEAAVRASAEQYRAIFDASADGLVLFDAEARIVDSNPAFAELFGYPRDALRKMSPRDLVAPESMAVCNQVLAVAADGAGFQGECRARRQDGSEFDVDLRGVPMQYMGKPHRLVVVRDITERRRADEQLRQSEARYRLLFEVESDAILLVDAETLGILDANRAAAELYGYSRDELLALEVTTLSVEPGDTASSIQRHTGSLRIPLRRHRRKDGTEILVEITSTIFQLSERKVVLATIRDITERRMREEALRRSDDRLRATVQAALDCIITMDGHGRIVEFNPAAEACFGYRRDEILGEVLADRLIPKRYRDAHRRGVERYLVSGDGPFMGRRIEVTAMRANGSEFPAELAIAVAEGPDGKIFVGYLRDITERRQAIEALQSSEEQYRAIFNASTDALVLWNSELRRVDINPAYERMYGFTRDEVLSESYPGHLPPESIEERKELIRRTLAGESIHAELGSVRKDGGRFHIEVDTTPIRYRGEPHVLSVVRDITERKRAEEERGRLEAQLRQAQKMEAIGQLTGGIAHDFNNILTSVLGYIVLGTERQSALGDAKLGRYLEQAQLAAQRARDLIQQMLTFSRGQRGERRAISLTPLVRESVNLLRSSLPATIELKMDLADGVPAVMSDPVQLEQVLLNLCINARDAMTGAGTIRVGVRVVESADGICASCRQKVAGRFVELSVADAGAGIAPEVLDRMFEPFFTTKDVGRGSGMGLAMVHGIVHDHGGHIVVDTAPGRGTTFRLQFAPAEEARPAAPAVPGERAPKHPRPQLSGRVLVVDDEEMVGEFMAEMLTNWGLDVTVKRSPIEAEVWYSHDPSRIDLVITDQTMPRLTGIELAQRLTGVRPDLPVILYTGYSDAVSDATMASSGVRALLKKPVDTDRLLALLRAHLPGTRSGAAAATAPTAAPKRARGKAPTKSSPRTTPRKTSRKTSRTTIKAPARKAPARRRAAATKRAAR